LVGACTATLMRWSKPSVLKFHNSELLCAGRSRLVPGCRFKWRPSWPLAAGAQQPVGQPLVGLLSPLSATAAGRNIAAFRQGMRDLGYMEGRNVAFALRFAEGDVTRLPALAHELVNLAALICGFLLNAVHRCSVFHFLQGDGEIFELPDGMFHGLRTRGRRRSSYNTSPCQTTRCAAIKRGEGHLDLAAGAGLEDRNLHPRRVPLPVSLVVCPR
jgi:hypothetical protein